MMSFFDECIKITLNLLVLTHKFGSTEKVE
jgi:hypothetical protein